MTKPIASNTCGAFDEGELRTMGTDADHWPDDLSLSLGEHTPAHIVPVRKLTPHARVRTSHAPLSVLR